MEYIFHGAGGHLPSVISHPRPTITGHTRLVGVIGWPVAHSLSPRMHNAAFAALGLNYAYVPLPVPPDRVADALRGLVALGFAGANVTVPYKAAVLPWLDALTPIAAAVGAVNTIVVRPDGTLLGDNTDGAGFLDDLWAHGIAIAGRGPREQGASQGMEARKGQGGTGGPVTLPPCHQVLLLGAGGAARAVAYALAEAGATVAVINRTPAKAESLCQAVGRALPAAQVSAGRFPDDLPALAPAAELIVNATSLGLHPATDPLPWNPAAPFHPGQIVYDLIYTAHTPFLALAEAAGARAIAGLGMLVHQGARAFELWTGQEAPIAVMRAAIEARGKE